MWAKSNDNSGNCTLTWADCQLRSLPLSSPSSLLFSLSLSLRVSGSSKWASKTKSKNAATTKATVRSPRNKTTNITNLNYLLSQQKKSISVLKKDVAAA